MELFATGLDYYFNFAIVFLIINAIADTARHRVGLAECFRLQAVRCGMPKDVSETNPVWRNLLYAFALWPVAMWRILTNSF